MGKISTIRKARCNFLIDTTNLSQNSDRILTESLEFPRQDAQNSNDAPDVPQNEFFWPQILLFSTKILQQKIFQQFCERQKFSEGNSRSFASCPLTPIMTPLVQVTARLHPQPRHHWSKSQRGCIHRHKFEYKSGFLFMNECFVNKTTIFHNR